MKTKLVWVGIAAAATAVMLSGCVVALGNRVPEDQNKKASPTLGRQLTDLKQARDSGALTEDEYQTAKKRLIEGK